MKSKVIAFFAVASVLLSACGQSIRFADTSTDAEEIAVVEEVQEETPAPVPAPVEEEPAAPEEVPAETESPTPAEDAAQPAETEAAPLEAPETVQVEAPAAEPAAEVAAPVPAASASAPAAPAPAPAPSLSYGGIPFNLAAGTEQWWQIDASDSAYWAVQENINAIRAAAGLGPLSMDSGLSAIASGRCQSFVVGGPFDHSGMVTASEICACGPLGSASAVCSAWQASPAHYAAMTGNFSRMGVGCWFCSTAEGNYTYWCVTFA